MLYLIWSFEHNAFWAANRDGYTRDAGRAGMYRQDIAVQIVEQARGNEIAFSTDGMDVRPAVIAYDPQYTLHVL